MVIWTEAQSQVSEKKSKFDSAFKAQLISPNTFIPNKRYDSLNKY